MHSAPFFEPDPLERVSGPSWPETGRSLLVSGLTSYPPSPILKSVLLRLYSFGYSDCNWAPPTLRNGTSDSASARVVAMHSD